MKQFFKFLICTFILLSITNCHEDNFDDNTLSQSNSKNIFVQQISLQDIEKNISSKITEKIASIKNTARMSDEQGKYTYNSELAIFIDFDNGKLINEDGQLYYNFPMYRESEEKLENILFVPTDNGEIETYFVKYDIKPQELEYLTEIEKENLDVEVQKVYYDSPEYICIVYHMYNTTQIYPECDSEDGHSNGHDCGPVTNTETWTLEFCSWTGGNAYDDGTPDNSTNSSDSYDGSDNTGGYSGSSSGTSNTISITPTLSQGEILSFQLSNLLNISDTEILIWIQTKRNWNKAQAVYDFLEDNDCGAFMSSSSSTTDCTQINNIGNSVLNIMIANADLSFEEAIEQFFEENPDIFIELLTVDQDNPHPIQNIDDYLDCFDDGKEVDNYGYIIYVDQPVDDTRNVFNYTNMTPGHTFFTLFKNNTDGTSVNITIGFYPEDNSYMDMNEWDGPGIFQDNGFSGDEHSFDIYITFDDINQTQFSGIINDIRNIANSDYDLDDYNCTNVAHNLAVDNLNFTMTPSTSIIPILPGAGSCINPGDYGEDLREMMYDSSNPYSGNIGIPIDNFNQAITSDGPCN